MSDISSAISSFLQSLAAIGAGLLNSVYAVFQAILALGRELVGSALQLVQVIVNFAANLFQGVLGFVIANFFAILIVGGVYYWFTTARQGARPAEKRRA